MKDQLLLILKIDCERQVFLPFLLPCGGTKENNNKKITWSKQCWGFMNTVGWGLQSPQEHFHFHVKSFLKDKLGWVNPLKGKNWEIPEKEISWVWVNQANLKLCHVYFKHCLSVYISFLWYGSLSVGGWYLFDVA